MGPDARRSVRGGWCRQKRTGRPLERGVGFGSLSCWTGLEQDRRRTLVLLRDGRQGRVDATYEERVAGCGNSSLVGGAQKAVAVVTGTDSASGRNSRAPRGSNPRRSRPPIRYGVSD